MSARYLRLAGSASMFRLACLVFLGGTLAACGSSGSRITKNTSSPEVLAGANKGTVVLYSSLRAEGCNLLYARIARGEENNRYIGNAQLSLGTANTTFVNDSRMPSTLTLAGDSVAMPRLRRSPGKAVPNVRKIGRPCACSVRNFVVRT